MIEIGSREKAKVLIVDDETEVLNSLADLLRKDFHIFATEDVNEAENLLVSQNMFSLVISDQRMPVKTGVELLSKAAKTSPDTARILLTGYADIDAVIEAVNQGQIVLYITKPWDAAKLIEILKSIAGKYNLLQENRRLIQKLAELNEQVINSTEQIETLKDTQATIQIENQTLKTAYEQLDKSLLHLRTIQERERLGHLVLERLTQMEDTKDTIHDILKIIKQSTGLDAVGLRLCKDDDFPYLAQEGFPTNFLLTENSLSVRYADGCLCKNENGKTSLECTCGLVISGHTEAADHFLTPAGSFWTNDSASLLNIPTAQDPRLHPRNRCINEGFHSVALIPLRKDKDIVGLLQLNDRQKDRFSLEMIQFFEDLCSNIGTALARKWADEEKARLILESSAKEMELMKYREKYNTTQQENAFTKELNIIKNDLFLKKIDVVNNRGETVEWVIDLYYKPLDILSGDSYSIREIEEGKVLIYLADAMGKGLAASVTSILSTSFVNHLVNEARERGGFDFREFIDTYSKIIRRELIEEEILCIKFIYIDLINEIMDTVICAMPPALCQAADNTIVKIENNNMPLMMYPAEMRIDRYDISNFHKILAHTDGLNESFRTNGSLYQEYLENDFRESEFGSHLSGRFNKTIKKPDDDVSFVFLRRIDRNPKWTKVFTIAARLEKVSAVAKELEEFIETLDADAPFKVMFINAFNEILMNAYEYGSLDINHHQKSRLVQDDTYQDYLLKAEKEITKKIIVTLSLHELSGNDYLMLTVADEGEGFDTSLLSKSNWEYDTISLNGRGVKLAQCLTDELFYNRVGNEVTLLKRIVRR